jgi:hypothetical protein
MEEGVEEICTRPSLMSISMFFHCITWSLHNLSLASGVCAFFKRPIKSTSSCNNSSSVVISFRPYPDLTISKKDLSMFLEGFLLTSEVLTSDFPAVYMSLTLLPKYRPMLDIETIKKITLKKKVVHSIAKAFVYMTIITIMMETNVPIIAVIEIQGERESERE